MSNNKLNIYSLNEFTTIWFLISVVKGEKPIVLDIAPVLPRLAIPIRKIVKFLSTKNRVRDIREFIPELIPELDYDQRVHFHNIFADIFTDSFEKSTKIFFGDELRLEKQNIWQS